MPAFEYTGQLSSGAALSGTLEAATMDEARAALMKMAIQVITLTQAATPRGVGPLSRDDVLFFNQQLASLANSGIALDAGLRVLAADLRRGKLRKVVSSLADAVERGTPLEEAIARHETEFPALYGEVLKAGVRNGQLGSTLMSFNSHLSLMATSRKLVWEAAAYPLVVVLMGAGLMTLFMMILMPQFEMVLAEFNDQLILDLSGRPSTRSTNWIAAALVAVSRQWSTIMLTCVVVLLAVAVIWRMLRMSPAGRSARESIVLDTPGVAGIYKASAISRFARAAAMGVRAGQDLPATLRLASGATGSPGLIHDAEGMARRIEEGATTAWSKLRLRIIPLIVCFSIEVSARRGQLAAALEEIADGYAVLARHRVGMFRALLSPLFVLIAAILLGLAVAAVFMPLIRMVDTLTGAVSGVGGT